MEMKEIASSLLYHIEFRWKVDSIMTLNHIVPGTWLDTKLTADHRLGVGLEEASE